MVDQIEYDYEENNHEENILPFIIYNSHPVIEEVTKNSVTSHPRIVKVKEHPLHEECNTKKSLKNVPQEINLERKYNFSEKICEIEERKIIPTRTQIAHNHQDHDEIKTLIIADVVFKEPNKPMKTIKEKSFVEEEEKCILMFDDGISLCNEIYSHDERKDSNQGRKSLKRKSLSNTCSLMVLMFTMLLQSSLVLGGIVYTKPGQLCSHCNSNKGHLFLETDEREDSYNRFLLPENYHIQLCLLKVNSEITVVLTISLIGDMQLAMSYLLQIDDIQRRLQNMKSEIVVILSITPIGDMPLSTSYFPLTNDKKDENLDNTLYITDIKDRNTYFDINKRKLSLNILEFEKHSLLGLNYGIVGNERKQRKLSMLEAEKHSLFQLNDWSAGNERTYFEKMRAIRCANDYYIITSFSKRKQRATRNVAYMKSVGYQHIDLYSIDDKTELFKEDWLHFGSDSIFDFHTEGNSTLVS
ncbi:Hypothetical predicted protein [Mytilus galloprovincialis]|nr:Hypothetical predicted protein [Mytilus galloprovincialis]